MEEKIYIINWSHKGKIWKFWVKGRPDWHAEGSDPEEVNDLLVERIMDGGGAMHPVFDMNPPLPPQQWELPFQNPEIYILCAGNCGFDSHIPCDDQTHWELPQRMTDEYRQWIRSFFSGPICAACRTPQGSRTARKLQVTALESGADGAFGHVGRETGRQVDLYSEHFIELLSPQERQRIEFQEIEGVGQHFRSRMRFFELVGPVGIPITGVKGLGLHGWRCKVCGHREFSCGPDFKGMTTFIAASDLLANDATMFTISHDHEISLCVTGARWRELKGQKGTRGFLPERLGIVPRHLVDRKPRLRTFQQARMP